MVKRWLSWLHPVWEYHGLASRRAVAVATVAAVLPSLLLLLLVVLGSTTEQRLAYPVLAVVLLLGYFLYSRVVMGAYRRRYALLFALSALGLLVTYLAGSSSIVLSERGQQVTAVVVNRYKPARAGPQCEIAQLSGERIPGEVSCIGLSVGDRVQVTVDPTGAQEPLRGTPGLSKVYLGITISGATMALTTVLAAMAGEKRKRQAGTMSPSPLPDLPPPPSAPPPGRNDGGFGPPPAAF
ncbi:hypothetical protein JJV70_03510 [Streptomyces sp. JJ66]|uniref:hypothetical protein n=1 Tax=Streptomyces sp. JJ66 TaxID=2803843 RepID=UPI001C57B06C|nr:hypothetical protein [Streptomyces sp. JJ66]MBW1601184.1 hypothetical protein [Streptomyces sp. JJ66]